MLLLLRRGQLAADVRHVFVTIRCGSQAALPWSECRVASSSKHRVLPCNVLRDLRVDVIVDVGHIVFGEFVLDVLVELRVAAGREDDADDRGADEGEKRTSERESFVLGVR